MKTIKTYLTARWLSLMLSLLLCPLVTVSMQAQTGKQTITHEVSSGETLYSLARKYNVDVEDIYQLNPSAKDGLRVGQSLRIPARHDASTTSGRKVSPSPKAETPEAEEELRPAVNVSLILPISEGGRYVNFYEGFLMALNTLKKDGVSVNLSVHDASTYQELMSLIRRGELYDADIVIGGKDEDQVKLLASTTGQGLYVSPFITTYDSPSPHKSTLHINQPAMNVGLNAVEAFLNHYRGRTVYFVGRTSDRSDVFAQTLRQRLIEEGFPYRTVNLDRDALKTEGSAVIVPIVADQSLAVQTLKAMQGLSSTTLFGYPQWQSYGQSFIEELGKWNSTIFSSFFFDPQGSAEKQFILHYNAWFSKKIADAYPKYSVLGYDLGCYLVRAHSQYGKDFLSMASYLPSDGLQMDIRPVRSGEESVWRNTCFYFITFSPDKTIRKTAL